MLFKFKQSKITVDCFTHDKAAFEVYKIRKSVYYYPETIKDMEANFTTTDRATNINYTLPTIKKCSGINSLYKHGAIIPLWADFISQPVDYVAGNAAVGIFFNPEQAGSHDPRQYPGIMSEYFNVKIPGAWHLVEPSGINFLWQAATWNLDNQNKDVIIPPGVLDFKWNAQTNLNMLVKKDLSSFKLIAGTPIVQIIPLTEKQVEYQCHLVSAEEYWSKTPQPGHFKSMLRWKKEKEKAAKLDAEEKKGRCPFGFK